jgi:multidrug resistance protein, MATE family
LTALALGGIVGVSNFSLLLALRGVWGGVYSNDDGVRARVKEMMPFVATYAALDALQGTVSGVVRGAGALARGAAINFVAFWVGAVPVGVALAFKAGLGLHGLWIGLIGGMVIQSSCLVVTVLKVDWATATAKAVARASKDKAPTPADGVEVDEKFSVPLSDVEDDAVEMVEREGGSLLASKIRSDDPL